MSRKGSNGHNDRNNREFNEWNNLFLVIFKSTLPMDALFDLLDNAIDAHHDLIGSEEGGIDIQISKNKVIIA